ncbi:MAG: DNA helicase RecQ [Caldilineaceae bacterium]
MKVVIVAKTRKGVGACIGAITFEGKSVRLIAADEGRNEQSGLEYNVGDVWEVQGAPATSTLAPHVEDWIVRTKTHLPLRVDPISFVELYMKPKVGDTTLLYDGFMQATNGGALYLAQGTGIPSHSTTFWRPDRPLQIDLEGKRIRYRYPTPDGGRTLTFVGFQEPLAEIPVGALLRVSLSRWWRPDERPEQELRCHVQLSGWFLAEQAMTSITDPSHSNGNGATTSIILPLATPPLATAQTLLKRIFGYDSFRPLQAEIIANILARRDTLVIMPTGGGKSLCYQLPALTFAGLTVVVSPLIALMQDQVEQLRQAGVAAIYLNSTLAYNDYLKGMNQVRVSKVKLLYLAPETLLRPEILLMLEQSNVDALVLDEAHCISQWGHDFRQEYRQLLPVRQRLPQAVCVALTATATPRVQEDIKTTLGLRHENTFVAGFDRPNLFIEVKQKANMLQQVLTFLTAHPEQSGIIYCATQQRVEELQGALTAAGVYTLPYHGGMASEERAHNQRAFMHDDARIMVATVAFGMGINKPDIRFVLHVDLPQDIEGYYQQIGRAGRDGLRAECLLLFSYGDVHTLHHFINEGAATEAEGRRARVQTLVDWAESFACRRKGLLAYFGENYPHEQCDMCDNCLRQKEQLVDLTLLAQKFLSCVVRAKEIFGVTHIIKVLRGSKSKEVLRWRHDQLSTYGIGRDYSEATWKHLAHQFIRQGLLKQVTGTGSLKLTEKGWAVCHSKEQVWGTMADGEVAAAAEATSYNAALFTQLRTLRKELADAEQLPPYIIFSDRTLQEMAAYYPQSRTTFSQIHGVGQLKLEKYADRFLALIQAYCATEQLAERPRSQHSVIKPPSAKPRSLLVGERFRNGESVAALQASYGVQRYTILQHLDNFVATGHALPPARLQAESQLTVEQQNAVMTHFDALGVERLRPILEAMGEQVPYPELHLLRACYRAMQMQADPQLDIAEK